jgi:hypothetical protein
MNARVSRPFFYSMLAMTLFASVTTSTRAQNTYQVDFPAAGEYVISLLGLWNTTIDDAESLLAVIPSATVISKFDASTNAFRDWDGASCSGAGPEPGAAATCGSGCFCVDTAEGLGYKVTVSGPGRWFITGDQARTEIALHSQGSGSPPSLTGFNLISLPVCTSLVDAEDLYNEIDALTGGNVAQVMRWDPGTLSFVGWIPGLINLFSIVPGEGYLVQVTANATYVPTYYPALTNFFSTPGEHIISLPANILRPPITNAEQLLAAIPGASDVAKWDPSTDLRHEWSIGGCVGLGPEPGHAAYGSSCFCVYPVDGEGFFVRSTVDAAMLMCGSDGFTSIHLQGPPASGSNLISLPFKTPLADAQDLIDDIDATAGTSVVAQVARFDTLAGGFDYYTGTMGTPFSIAPGEGYLVQVTAPVNYLPPFDPNVTALPGVYVITGTVTTPAYSWLVQDSTNRVVCNNLNAVLVGTSAADIANSLAGDVNANCSPNAGAIANLNTVRVDINPASSFVGPALLFVGDTGSPNCPVTMAGCTFNPTITLVPDSAVIPMMSEIALVALALAVVAVATVVLLRRSRQREDLIA